MRHRITVLLLLVAAFCLSVRAQSGAIQRWSSTTGDVSLSSAAYAATIQQPSSAAIPVYVDKVLVYCSVACDVTFRANGTAATTTLGTVTPLLPTVLSTTAAFSFYAASNVGTGTIQGGVIHLPGGAPPVAICFSQSCGESANYMMVGAGGNVNFSVSVASMTGTFNATFLTHTVTTP